jgi:hypothetical protein
MSMIFAATDPETLKNLALGGSVVSIVIALVLMKVVSSIVGKVISAAIFVAIALAGYSQRAEITECADKVKAQTTTTASVNTTCTFFGQDVTIKVPLPAK